jgi:hypothetical protein
LGVGKLLSVSGASMPLFSFCGWLMQTDQTDKLCLQIICYAHSYVGLLTMIFRQQGIEDLVVNNAFVMLDC